MQGPLTLVCAGAGYGKTTLVSSWIESLAAGNASTAPVPAAWISLDERDSDLGLFLRYFTAALRTMFPDACAETISLLRATRQPPFDLLCATLINEIAALPQEFILVLDDYHLITGAAVPDLFGEFERHWPQPMHMVLLSRYTPVLSLASLRAKGHLTEIRMRDLRFTRDETAGYLELLLRKPLGQRAIELLERCTEGWIAGLQLASLSLHNAENPEGLVAGLSGLDAGFADYLTDDVLARQPAAIVWFLLQTAILDRFCLALCEAAISSEEGWNARRCLAWVEQHNLFVNALDSHDKWYAYHQLFRDVLLQRAMAELAPDRVSALQRRAAAWFAHRGQVDEAVRYALAAGDREMAAGFVAQGLCEALNREDRPTLDRWLSYFPDGFVQDRADLLIVRGWSLALSWQVGSLVGLLPRAAAVLEQESRMTAAGTESGTLRGCLATLSAFVALIETTRMVWQPTAEKLWRSCLTHGQVCVVRPCSFRHLPCRPAASGRRPCGLRSRATRVSAIEPAIMPCASCRLNASSIIGRPRTSNESCGPREDSRGGRTQRPKSAAKLGALFPWPGALPAQRTGCRPAVLYQAPRPQIHGQYRCSARRRTAPGADPSDRGRAG